MSEADLRKLELEYLTQSLSPLFVIGGSALLIFGWWLWRRTTKMQQLAQSPWEQGAKVALKGAAVVLGGFQVWMLIDAIRMRSVLTDSATALQILAHWPIAYMIWNLDPLLMAIPSLILWRLAPVLARLAVCGRRSWPEVVVRVAGIVSGMLAAYPLLVVFQVSLLDTVWGYLRSGQPLGFSGIDRLGAHLETSFTICEFLGLAAFLFFLAPYAAGHCLPPSEDADTAG